MDESVVDGKDFKAPDPALLNGFRFKYRARKNSAVRNTLQRSGARGNCLAPSDAKQSHPVQKELIEEVSTPRVTVTPDVNKPQTPAPSASEAVSKEVLKSSPPHPRVSAVRNFPNGRGKDSANGNIKLNGRGINSTSTNAEKDSLEVVLALPASCADVSKAKVDEPKSQVKDCSKKRKRRKGPLHKNEAIVKDKRDSMKPIIVSLSAGCSRIMKTNDAVKDFESLQDLSCDSNCVVNQVGGICTRHSNLEPSSAYSVDAEKVNVDALESHVKYSDMKIKMEDESPRLNQAIERHEKSSSLQKPVTVDYHQSVDAVAARQKVMEALFLFETIYTKILEDGELKRKLNPKEPKKPLQADMVAFKLFNQQYVNPSSGMKHIGSAPGVEVGDEFNLRVELCIAGLHLHHRHCIDFTDHRGKMVAISIVHMTPYTVGTTIVNDFVYSSTGDFKLDGNLALKNSLDTRTPIRVIHGFSGYKSSNFRATRAKRRIITYIYGGLYLVKKDWRKKGGDGLYTCKFQLRRITEQPEHFTKETKGSIDSKARPGWIIKDISEGKERLPISVVNTIDDEHPKPFKYIAKMTYSSQHSRSPPTGCDCVGRCSDSDSCACAVKNGGEIPFNFSGAFVEAKPLVYECTPSCKCPPSCHNRVSQHGIKFHLEVFKTELRGWGVRSLDLIPSGSFVCEYTGELIDDQIADKRANDEYLFDIGNNYYDETLWKGLNTKVPDLQIGASTEVEEGSFAVDALEQGNVARFVNHSCTPNLYAQNLLHDHDNKTMPHVILFAAEDIPPLQELTYDYNYAIDQVHDSNGNIKKKVCYCGTSNCTGWLY